MWYDWCPYEKEKFGHRHTLGECQMKMKAEIPVLLLQARECQRLPANPQKLREKPHKAFRRLLVEIQLLKVLLVWSQMKMRNMILETGEKEILVKMRQRTWLNCVLFLESKTWKQRTWIFS